MMIAGMGLAQVLTSKYVLYPLAAILVAGSLFVGGCNHGKKVEARNTAQVQAAFEAYVKLGEANLNRIENEAKTAVYEAKISLADSQQTLTQKERENERLIQAYDSLARSKLSKRTVSLFNSTAGYQQGVSKPTTAPEGFGSTNGQGTSAEDAASKVSLQDLLLVVNENNANHLRCIDKVDAWQMFYKELYSSFEGKHVSN